MKVLLIAILGALLAVCLWARLKLPPTPGNRTYPE